MSALPSDPQSPFPRLTTDPAPIPSPESHASATPTSPPHPPSDIPNPTSSYTTPPRQSGDHNSSRTTREPAALFFRPGEQQTADIIEEIVSPFSTFSHIAERHGTNIEALSAWALRPEIASRIDAIESMCARRTRAVAVNHLPICIEAMTRVLNEYNWDESHILYPYDSVRHNEQKRRNRETAVRAARVLLQFAHFTPGPQPPKSPRPPRPDSSPRPPDPTQPRDPSSHSAAEQLVDQLAPNAQASCSSNQAPIPNPPPLPIETPCTKGSPHPLLSVRKVERSAVPAPRRTPYAHSLKAHLPRVPLDPSISLALYEASQQSPHPAGSALPAPTPQSRYAALPTTDFTRLPHETIANQQLCLVGRLFRIDTEWHTPEHDELIKELRIALTSHPPRAFLNSKTRSPPDCVKPDPNSAIFYERQAELRSIRNGTRRGYLPQLTHKEIRNLERTLRPQPPQGQVGGSSARPTCHAA